MNFAMNNEVMRCGNATMTATNVWLYSKAFAYMLICTNPTLYTMKLTVNGEKSIGKYTIYYCIVRVCTAVRGFVSSVGQSNWCYWM